jgi:hypothetical protein
VRSVAPGGEDGYDVVGDGADDPRPDLAAMAVHRGWGLIEMRSAAMSLEEVFIQLTTEEGVPAGEVNDPREEGR